MNDLIKGEPYMEIALFKYDKNNQLINLVNAPGYDASMIPIGRYYNDLVEENENLNYNDIEYGLIADKLNEINESTLTRKEIKRIYKQKFELKGSVNN
jgi:hypothetical protein